MRGCTPAPHFMALDTPLTLCPRDSAVFFWPVRHTFCDRNVNDGFHRPISTAVFSLVIDGLKSRDRPPHASLIQNPQTARQTELVCGATLYVKIPKMP